MAKSSSNDQLSQQENQEASNKISQINEISSSKEVSNSINSKNKIIGQSEEVEYLINSSQGLDSGANNNMS